MADNQKVRAWIEIGKKRIQQILFTRIVANPRTLEQKISDAGPFNQRTEPLYLTRARVELEREGIIDSRWGSVGIRVKSYHVSEECLYTSNGLFHIGAYD